MNNDLSLAGLSKYCSVFEGIGFDLELEDVVLLVFIHLETPVWAGSTMNFFFVSHWQEYFPTDSLNSLSLLQRKLNKFTELGLVIRWTFWERQNKDSLLVQLDWRVSDLLSPPLRYEVENSSKAYVDMLAQQEIKRREREEWRKEWRARLNARREERIEEETRKSAPKKVREDKGVYIIKSGDFFKIGKSVDISRRVFKEISPKLPQDCELIRKYLTDKHTDLELSLHEKFKEIRANGEWFELKDQDLVSADGFAIDFGAKVLIPNEEEGK